MMLLYKFLSFDFQPRLPQMERKLAKRAAILVILTNYSGRKTWTSKYKRSAQFSDVASQEK